MQPKRSSSSEPRLPAPFSRRIAAIAVVAGAFVGLAPSTAVGQQAHVAGGVDLIAGLEGGGSGYAAGVRRTRTTMRFGAEGYLDEAPDHGLSVGALVELEPRGSFGADLRYMLRFGKGLMVHAGATGIIAPNYLIGASFGFAYRLNISQKVELNVNPLGNVYFYGGDLAKDTVLWQGMLAVGVRIGLF